MTEAGVRTKTCQAKLRDPDSFLRIKINCPKGIVFNFFFSCRITFLPLLIPAAAGITLSHPAACAHSKSIWATAPSTEVLRELQVLRMMRWNVSGKIKRKTNTHIPLRTFFQNSEMIKRVCTFIFFVPF